MSADKQISRVLAAVNDGCFTSDMVSAFTGLPLKTASAWLSVLAEEGLIIMERRHALRIHRRGGFMHVYGPVKDPVTP